MQMLTLDKLPQRLLAGLDIVTVFKASRCVIAAEQLQLFRKLYGKELTAAEIGRRIGLHQRHRETFLNIIAAMGLLTRKGKRYRLSALARKYFIKERGPHWTRLWSQYCAEDYTALSILEKSLTTGRDYRKQLGMKREEDYEVLRHDRPWAKGFTRVMHDTKRTISKSLARNLDLSGYKALLDVGGGLGIMAMELVRKHPNLRACVQDFGPVCREARKIIKAEGLAKRVRTYAADMDKEIASGYDVVMYWDMGIISVKSLKLAYQALPPGGMLLIGGCFSDKEDRSVNLLTRKLTLTYPDHASRQATVVRRQTIRTSGVEI